MTINFLKPCAVAFFAATVTLPTMFGNIVSPGTTVSPDVFTSTSGFTVLATTGAVVIDPVPGRSFDATYTETVVRDTNNVFCSTCLDFLIVASNAGPGVFERISTSFFDSYLTDVGYNSALPAGVDPSTVDRSADGNVIGFNFLPPGTSVNTGQRTAVLEIQTNAMNYAPGFVSVQDGTSGFGAGFQPAAATPEPTYMALVGAGMLGLGLIRRRKAA